MGGGLSEELVRSVLRAVQRRVGLLATAYIEAKDTRNSSEITSANSTRA